MKKTFSILILASFFCSYPLFSQISEGGMPWGFQNEIPKELETVEMAKFNIRKDIKQSLEQEKKTKAVQYARTFDLDISLNSHGCWTILEDGTRVWFLSLKSKDAYSISVIFKEYELPPEAKLYVYNIEKTHYRGAFTHNNNKSNKRLAIAPVAGDEIIIEYMEPFHAEFKGKLAVGLLSHDYMDILNTVRQKDGRFGSSGSCNPDINCEVGTDWQEVKHAVCRLHINASKFCTGNLINNTANDGTPYLLTANHCVLNQGEADDILVVFNYESPYCNGPDGSTSHSISNSSLKATSNNLDFTLLELSTQPPDTYKPFYVGWNHRDQPSANVTSIHHPLGDVKKISVDLDTAFIGHYGPEYDMFSWWKIAKWDIGTTESGSSGSGLFDANKRLIGTLTGGEASCSNSINDFYSRFDLAWDKYYVDSATSLWYWLDPFDLEPEVWDGYNPSAPKLGFDIQLVSIVSLEDMLCGQNVASPQIIVKNNGIEPINKIKIIYSIDSLTVDSLTWFGELSTNAFDTVSLGSFELDDGNHTVFVELGDPNDIPDENTDDNSTEKAFVVMDGQKIRLDLTTDDFGTETTWQLTDSLNNVLFSGGPYPDGAQTAVSEDFCLDYGSYDYTIYDLLADGICCDFGHGSFTLTNLETNQIIGTGGAFADSAQVGFSLDEPAYMADFVADTTTVYAGTQIQFYDMSANANSWSWYFENGIPESSSEQNPSVLYQYEGIFDVSLSINDSSDSKIVEDYITVMEIPVVADFIADTDTIFMNSHVQFTDLSQNASNWSWHFEGGVPSQSSKQNPVVVYLTPGSYTVGLSINDSAHYKIAEKHITVLDLPCNSDFVVDTNQTYVNNAIQFIDQSENVSSWLWSFENGLPSQSTVKNPVVLYLEPGTFDVGLSINDSADIKNTEDYITVLDLPGIADFNADTTRIYENNYVCFYDKSQNANQRIWYFENGIPAVSTLQNPVVLYREPGKFDVKLSVNDSTHYKLAEDYILVVDSPAIADFHTPQTSVCEGSVVKFIDKSRRASSYSWSFEGGMPSESNRAAPEIKYNKQGYYTVSLTINDTIIKTKEKYIFVGEQPSIGFDISEDVPFTTQAIITGGTQPYYYYWNNNENGPAVSNLSEGIYSLAIVDSAGCVVTAPFQIKGSDDLMKNTIERESYKIFPNPSTSKVFVELLDNGFESLEVVDIYGKKMLGRDISGDRVELDFSGYSGGIYLILLYSKGKVEISKIIIE